MKLSGEITPGVQVLGECTVATSSQPLAPSVSPDGSRVAWSDEGGAKIATVTVSEGADGQPCGGSTTTVSATGLNPVFSAAAPPTNGGGGKALKVKGPSTATRARVNKGVTYSGKCSSTCTVKATMKAGNKTVARDKTTVKGQGTARVRLRASLKRSVKVATVKIASGGRLASRSLRILG